MPITLPPISRRRFLASATAATAAMALGGNWSIADTESSKADHLVLLSDTHISSDRKHDPRQQGPMWDHFVRVRSEILRSESRPRALLINGDCAFSKGLPADYAALLEGLEPIRAAGLPVHLGLGNHDSRANIQEILPADATVTAQGLDHRVMRVSMPHANWYMLDSLDQTNHTPGRLGAEQLKWLARSLDQNPQRPAILMMHHQPDYNAPEISNGLRDTPALMNVISKRKQVKAVLFGHTHVWKHYEREGIHFINLPTTAYVFKPEQPIGWVDAHVTSGNLRLQLHAITPNHPQHLQVLELN
jgi:3',5'-cyclic-AMP phosphodiesterase